MASHLRLSLLVGFGGIEAVDTEFPYRVPIVDRGAIAVPLFADPISDSKILPNVHGAICLKTRVLLGNDLVTGSPLELFRNSLVLFVRFFGIVSPFWLLKWSTSLSRGFRRRDTSMGALWSDRQNCSRGGRKHLIFSTCGSEEKAMKNHINNTFAGLSRDFGGYFVYVPLLPHKE